MGFDSQWPKMWGQQSSLFVVQRVVCKTIFIDAQIQLMKSFVKEDETSWRQFIRRTFFAPVAEFHRRYDTVIVCFDNYQNVPVFKSIEQSKRTAASSAAKSHNFQFKAGDELPSKPYEQKIWVQALQNRSFKSNIISLITSMMAAEYTPPRVATTLVIDFVNSTRIDYLTHSKTRTVLEHLKPMGESDVKFMRYVPLFGDMCVDSIDSDVLLIAALFVSRNSYKGNIYVRRYKTRLPAPPSSAASAAASIPNTTHQGPGPPAGQETAVCKRKAPEAVHTKPEKRRLEYEIIHVNLLLGVLHTTMHNAAAMSSQNDQIQQVSQAHLTAMLSFMVLLCGCDYSKKLPRIGVKSLWDNMDVVVPAMMQCTSYVDNVFAVDTEVSINGLIASLYARIYTKHVASACTSNINMHAVLARLHASTLSDKTKNDLPTHDSLNTTLRNIEWVINYWSIENGDPICPIDGTHGFLLVNNKIVAGGPPPAQ